MLRSILLSTRQINTDIKKEISVTTVKRISLNLGAKFYERK